MFAQRQQVNEALIQRVERHIDEIGKIQCRFRGLGRLRPRDPCDAEGRRQGGSGGLMRVQPVQHNPVPRRGGELRGQQEPRQTARFSRRIGRPIEIGCQRAPLGDSRPHRPHNPRDLVAILGPIAPKHQQRPHRLGGRATLEHDGHRILRFLRRQVP